MEVLAARKLEAQERAAAETAAARAAAEAQAETRQVAALEASARRRQAFLSTVCYPSGASQPISWIAANDLCVNVSLEVKSSFLKLKVSIVQVILLNTDA